MSESEQKEKIWYYREVIYKSGKNNGQSHYEYNWDALRPEVDKAIKFFEGRGMPKTSSSINASNFFGFE